MSVPAVKAAPANPLSFHPPAPPPPATLTWLPQSSPPTYQARSNWLVPPNPSRPRTTSPSFPQQRFLHPGTWTSVPLRPNLGSAVRYLDGAPAGHLVPPQARTSPHSFPKPSHLASGDQPHVNAGEYRPSSPTLERVGVAIPPPSLAGSASQAPSTTITPSLSAFPTPPTATATANYTNCRPATRLGRPPHLAPAPAPTSSENTGEPKNGYWSMNIHTGLYGPVRGQQVIDLALCRGGGWYFEGYDVLEESGCDDVEEGGEKVDGSGKPLLSGGEEEESSSEEKLENMGNLSGKSFLL
ncbi:hypothetical protein VTI74DRAFT_2766 [Chaetomium olivicolor]